jgi:hypothetical protein
MLDCTTIKQFLKHCAVVCILFVVCLTSASTSSHLSPSLLVHIGHITFKDTLAEPHDLPQLSDSIPHFILSKLLADPECSAAINSLATKDEELARLMTMLDLSSHMTSVTHGCLLIEADISLVIRSSVSVSVHAYERISVVLIPCLISQLQRIQWPTTLTTSDKVILLVVSHDFEGLGGCTVVYPRVASSADWLQYLVSVSRPYFYYYSRMFI